MRARASRRRPGAKDVGAYWISYSDMMSSLLLVFVLAVCFSIYQYYSLLETKTRELGEQQAELDKTQITLAQREQDLETTRVTLMGKEEELATIQIQLQEQEDTLHAAQTALKTQEEAQAALQLQLTDQETQLSDQALRLAAMQDVLSTQQQRIDDLLGIRTAIIKDLSSALSAAHLSASVDRQTGDIVLDSSLLFETGSTELKATGQTQLYQLIPVYLSVLTRPEYNDYVAEIIIEGHTDSKGSYEYNLELSQNRALGVTKYCLSMGSITGEQRLLLQDILTAKGRSYSDLIYNADGTENMDASRRVEIKFRLKDAEMIAEMNKILTGAD